MLCSNLLNFDGFKDKLFDGKGIIPTIPMIQKHIETGKLASFLFFSSLLLLTSFCMVAWAKGFDPAGAKQLNSTLSGSRKWIGMYDSHFQDLQTTVFFFTIMTRL